MGLTRYVGSLVRGWYLLVIGLLVGGAGAFGYLQVTQPLYTSDIQFFVSTPESTDIATAAAGVSLAEARTASYVQLVGGRELADTVIEDLGLDMSVGELRSEISASVLPSTVIVDVSVSDPSPDRAFAIAQSIGTQFSAQVSALETAPGATEPTVLVSVVAAPELPTSPSSPDTLLTLLAGLAAGVVLGAVGAVVRDRLDTSVRDEETAAEASGAPVLGLMPDLGTRPEILDWSEISPAEADAVQGLQTNLRFVSVGRRARILVITSADQSEGKTTTAIRMAQVLANAGQRVVLVEADVRRPRVTRHLGAISGAGLTNVLVETAELDDVLQPVGYGTLDVLGSGPLPPNPSELLGGAAMQALLGNLAERYDVVLLDAPPLLPVADALGLAALSDGVLLCVRWGGTSGDRLVRARALLDRAGATTLGAIVTFVPPRAAGHDRYDYQDAPTEEQRRGLLRRRGAPAPRSTVSEPHLRGSGAGDVVADQPPRPPIPGGAATAATATRGV